ncbi:ofd1 [Symbiodinium pilosum]|uniref:Ofd1 protein n=1 Tax=Symbiodinium pilosum TaxID=2952 RepID=A0A812W994_SYMPI|nr:ofd1 [Symbiodinium pilosum]
MPRLTSATPTKAGDGLQGSDFSIDSSYFEDLYSPTMLANLLLITPVFYSLMMFRTSKAIFGSLSKRVTVDLIMHYDMLWRVVIDMVDQVDMFYYARLAEWVGKDALDKHRQSLVLIQTERYEFADDNLGASQAALPRQAVTFASDIRGFAASADAFSERPDTTEFYAWDLVAVCSCQAIINLIQRQNVIIARKRSAIASIFLIDVPFLTIRVWLWTLLQHTYFPGLGVKNGLCIVLSVMQYTLVALASWDPLGLLDLTNAIEVASKEVGHDSPDPAAHDEGEVMSPALEPGTPGEQVAQDGPDLQEQAKSKLMKSPAFPLHSPCAKIKSQQLWGLEPYGELVCNMTAGRESVYICALTLAFVLGWVFAQGETVIELFVRRVQELPMHAQCAHSLKELMVSAASPEGLQLVSPVARDPPPVNTFEIQACGMTSADVLTAEEIAQALSLQNVTAYRLAAKLRTDEPLLARLLRVVAASQEPMCSSTAVQTDPQGIGESIDEKLRACAVPDEQKDRRTIEERMLQFRARCEAMVRKEAEAELARVRMLEREQIALEEAAKSRAEVQEAVAKAKRELSDKEERLRQRERLANERTRAKELDLEKKAVEWRATAQQVIDEEQMRQSTRSKHLDVEDKRLQMLKEGLDRREQEVRLAEANQWLGFCSQERNSASVAELARRAEEAKIASRVAVQASDWSQRMPAREGERIQMAGAREHQEALKDRLVAETTEAERSANQARKDARAAEECLSAKARELEDAREQIQLLKVAGQQVVAFQQELESLRAEKMALQHKFNNEVQAHTNAEAEVGQLQKDRSRLSAEVEKLEEKLVAAEGAPSSLVRQLQEARSRLSTEASESEKLRQQLQVAEQRAAPQKAWVSALQSLEQEPGLRRCVFMCS